MKELPQSFVEDTAKKIEKYGLKISITPAELEAACAGDPHCEQALADMLRYAVRYVSDVWSMKEFVANKEELPDEEWAEKHKKIDSDRTQLHNTYIDSIAILSRAMMRAEKDNSWVRELAPTGTLDRATCGKFAIMLSYWLSVNKRR
jgi:hypothetical protein